MFFAVVAVSMSGLYSGCHIKSVGPDNNAALVDTDGDGIPNVNDPDIDNDGKLNSADDDVDGDGVLNTADSDIDGDGVSNIDDNDIDGDGIANTDDNDIDGDGVVNAADTDIDGDGIANIDDNDIDGDGIANTSDSDIDGDGVANAIDSDLDGDGVVNTADADIDGDGIANTNDADIDNDGIANATDSTPGGTGADVDGTEGVVNTGSGTDSDTGAVNTGSDTDSGETDGDVYVEGIGVVAEDTVGFIVQVKPGQGVGTVSTEEVVNLQDVRDVLRDNEIDLATVGISNMAIVAGSSPFVLANSATKVVVKVSYIDEQGNKILALESAEHTGLAGPVLTVADLSKGVNLNEEIFGTATGYASFVSLVKDESKSSITTIIDVSFLDAPQGGGDIPLDFIFRATGKKPF